MRLFFAVVYIILGISLTASFVSEQSAFVLPIILMLLLFSASYIFNEGFIDRVRGVSEQEALEELKKKGLVTTENFKLGSVINFEDLNTGCIVYLIDVGDGILCLNGQYLYDFDPITDDPDVNQSRRFPTENFSVLRHDRTGKILELMPGTDIKQPRVIQQPNLNAVYDLGVILEDGEIITTLSINDLECVLRLKS